MTSKKEVFHDVLRSVAETDPECKFIQVRCVDVNKGTKEVPKVRSRLMVNNSLTEKEGTGLVAARFLLFTRPRCPPFFFAGHHIGFLLWQNI